MNLIALFGAIALAQPLPAAPQALAPQTSPPLAAPVATDARPPALTPLRLRVEGEISSKTHVTGDKILSILADGAAGHRDAGDPGGYARCRRSGPFGQKGMSGTAGELLIAARTLDLAPGVSLPFRHATNCSARAPAEGTFRSSAALTRHSIR